MNNEGKSSHTEKNMVKGQTPWKPDTYFNCLSNIAAKHKPCTKFWVEKCIFFSKLGILMDNIMYDLFMIP